MRSLSACLLCICLGFSARAGAQDERDPGSDPTTPATSPAPAPGAREPVDLASGALPEVSDAMLEPIEAPPRVLSSWRQAVTLVQSRSTSLATARARIAEASGRSRQVQAGGLPNISANGSVNRNLLFATGSTVLGQGGLTNNVRLPYPPTVWNAGVSLRQPVFDLQTWYDMATSSTAVEAAEAGAEDAERLTFGALANVIVGVITAERLSEVSRVSLRSNLAVLDLTQRRTRLGAASAVDVLRTQQEVASARTDVVQADETVRQQRESLGMALGYPDAWGVAPNIKLDALAADARAQCSSVADPEQRSDVRAAKLNVEVSEQAAESVKYAHSPTLDVVSDFSYTTDPRSARPVLWSIGAVLTIPIYEGGRIAAQRDVNVAVATAARQQLTDAVRNARLEAVQTQRGVTVAEANFALSRQARDIAAESARLSRIAFVHGTGTSFDLVDTAQRHRAAEIDVTIKEFEVVRARIAALLALSNCSL
jgi:outer membrane protein, multidrug efflux system